MLGDTIFSPEIFALITIKKKKEKEKKPRQKGGLRLIEMPNKYKIQDKNLIYISETVENILNHACMINKLEA